MANLFAHVPSIAPPPLPSPVHLFLPLANLACRLTFSTPPSGSLATTWVTPATLGLAALVFFLGIPGAFLAAGSLAIPPTPSLLLGLFLLLVSLFAFSIAFVGLSQRVQAHTHHTPPQHPT